MALWICLFEDSQLCGYVSDRGLAIVPHIELGIRKIGNHCFKVFKAISEGRARVVAAGLEMPISSG
jgi:hypothetical protein